ncbi:MAG: hypothetical protein ACYDG2_03700 [Ruminiclostridium sp.]
MESVYTGCLPIVSIKEEIITNKNGDWNKNDIDSVIFVNQDGILNDTVKLPRYLPWNIAYSDLDNSLFIDVDHVIFKYNIDIKEKMPLYFANGGSFLERFISRAIDRHRPNSRILKKMLRLSDTSDISTVLYAHAATITDNYDESYGVKWDL